MFYIEHSGSKEHNKLAKDIRDFIEDEYGDNVEFLIGDSRSPLILYTENMRPIYQTAGGMFNDEIIKFYIELSQEKDNVKNNNNTILRSF